MAQNPKAFRKRSHRWMKLPRIHGSKSTRFNSLEEFKNHARVVFERFRVEDETETRKASSLKSLKPIQTEQDYHEAMARLEKIFCLARKGTAEGEEFERLAILISDWEKKP